MLLLVMIVVVVEAAGIQGLVSGSITRVPGSVMRDGVAGEHR